MLVTRSLRRRGLLLELEAAGAASRSAAALHSTGLISTPARSACAIHSCAHAATSTSPASAGTTHVVVEGETLSSIAEQWFGRESDWPRIVAANPGLDPNRLKIGQKLILPSKATSGVNRGGAAPAPAEGVASARPTPGSSYRVRSGDSLSRISQEAYGSAKYWNVIYQANRSVIGSDPADLSLGMALVIPKSPR